ncbi:VanZ family protein [Clostridium cellulovorans]|uniref:VanZ family protein n=1 Tax=Clostridium cellulovorans (strain ATCC 35296 / DSM 3052 / OCM 3 / 743B) TaxID=573061 RepID=D9SWN4_CLOC7|nr:VanZ family protein [Clostridium cellulovorans]ADL53316.1 VanZ family protein [Clostridium cellulovorans 743B]
MHFGGNIRMYMIIGIIDLIRGIPIAILVYAVILGTLLVSKKRKKIEYNRIIVEFIFVLYIVAILKITGVIGMTFNIYWFIDGLRFFEFSLPFDNASLKMVVLNLLLFVPFGFLLPIAIRSEKWNWKKALMTGLLFSMTIETLQMFAGRMSEIDDLIMNSLGTLLGYCVITKFKWVTRKSSK